MLVELTSAGRVGFGTYRAALEHGPALDLALARGCRLIDTAPHYGDGEAERMVGEILRASHADAFVITKVGYVTADLAADLPCATSHLPQLDATTRYSLDPELIAACTARSRVQLGAARLDAVCVHNPEHLVSASVAETDVWDSDTLAAAFAALEHEVADGRLGCYGVSSNVLSAGSNAEQAARVERLIRLARSVGGPAHHLRLVQFPWNLLEHAPTDAGIVATARRHGLATVAHRVLNATWRETQVRLADDDGREPDDAGLARALTHAVTAVETRLAQLNINRSPWAFAPMQFLRDQCNAIDHPDLVDLIFAKQIAPFVHRLFGDEPAGQAAFADVHDHARRRAAAKLSAIGASIRADLVAHGTVAPDDDRPLAVIAAAFPLRCGIDHVLVGMRQPRYVEQLIPLIQETRDVHHSSSDPRSSGGALHLQLPSPPGEAERAAAR